MTAGIYLAYAIGVIIGTAIGVLFYAAYLIRVKR